MAVEVVNDDEVRSAFEKILWASVGQEPDVRELLGSLMKQINEQTLKPDLCDRDALAEVKKAAKGLKCLLVLDDVVSEQNTQRDPHTPWARSAHVSQIQCTHPVGGQVRTSTKRDRPGYSIEAHGYHPGSGADQGRQRGGRRHSLAGRRVEASSGRV